MATPVGHLLTGAAIGIFLSRGSNVPRKAFLGALAGIAADFDFIPGLMFGDPSHFHHAQSHSLLFAILAAFIAALLANKARANWAVLIGLAYASHLALDLLTRDGAPPYGIPIFWPWSADVFQSPVTLFPSVSWGTDWALSDHNVNLLLRELGFLGPLFISSLIYAHRRRHILEEALK